MSNVSVGTKFEKITEISVPLRDGKCTARDIDDLMRVARERCQELTPDMMQYDDAFWVYARDDELVAIIRTDEPRP